VEIGAQRRCGNDQDRPVHRRHRLPCEQDHEYTHALIVRAEPRGVLNFRVPLPSVPVWAAWDNRRMLDRRTLLDREGIVVDDVACRHHAGHGHAMEPSQGHALVFVRRGCFVRRADGASALMDPTVAFCRIPGQEQRYDHPNDDGDDCTTIALDAVVAASVWGGEPDLPAELLPVAPEVDLEHRRLLAAARRGADADTLYERALNLAAAALEQHDPRPVAAGRPQTKRARRRLVDDAREALAGDPACSLPQLANQLAVSPHHLSRVFHSHTGHTISRHRLLLRARAALERFAGGDPQLARLAAEVGFSDQSHFSRALRTQTGHTPSALRRMLG
jgi:AraC-like DNA-binding protein